MGRQLPRPPVRMVHMGLGAFHRAHQAWYTDQSTDAWGIAAFGGRRRSPVVRRLAAQDGLYSLVERGPEHDRASIVSCLVEARDGDDMRRFGELLASPATAVLTMTVTESGYHLAADGGIDWNDAAVGEDLRILRAGSGTPCTALGRLLHGLEARRQSQAGPLAVVPCDNIADNGRRVGRALTDLAARVRPGLAGWIERYVSFVATSVDRITPATEPGDAARAALLTGWRDEAPVVAEPFRDWVLSGAFPAGRPPWEHAGAQFVEDIAPFERRKLWLLNGAHSLLAYAAPLYGHETVAQAIGDERMRAWVEQWWDEAARHLPAASLALDDYRRALLQRFSNARICHMLGQIAVDGVAKLRVRIVPVALAERRAGRDARGAARVAAAWAATWLRSGRGPGDAQHDAIRRALAQPGDRVESLVALLDESLARDSIFMRCVRETICSLPSDAECKS